MKVVKKVYNIEPFKFKEDQFKPFQEVADEIGAYACECANLWGFKAQVMRNSVDAYDNPVLYIGIFNDKSYVGDFDICLWDDSTGEPITELDNKLRQRIEQKMSAFLDTM